jgi:hypothetical protein
MVTVLFSTPWLDPSPFDKAESRRAGCLIRTFQAQNPTAHLPCYQNATMLMVAPYRFVT